MNILAIDTSSTSGSIAISKKNKIEYIQFLDLKITHSERLMPQIAFGLEQCKMVISDINAILISNGPGSFTGLRIGLATAKGLSYANKIPIIPFNSIEMSAVNLYGNSNNIVVFNDAKMGEVYAGMFTPKLEKIIPSGNFKPQEFLDLVKGKVTIIGSGISVYKELISNTIDADFALIHQTLPIASSLISLFELRKIDPIYDLNEVASLEPDYMRKSQAEIVREKKLERDKA